MARNPRWQRNELILALDLYQRVGMVDSGHPDVVALSTTLNHLNADLRRDDPERFRNPNGVAMKLANFAALDPAHPGMALAHGGRGDAVIWDEFAADGDGLTREAKRIHSEMSGPAERRYWVLSEAQQARDTIAVQAGKKRSGQGFQISPEARRAIENHAMAMAMAHYTGKGWSVTDVSAHESYDLVCRGPHGEELRVEVKGTVSDGSEVLLTVNEVEHARSFPSLALFVVADIEMSTAEGDPIPLLTGGRVIIIEPWKLETERLRAIGFAYSLA